MFLWFKNLFSLNHRLTEQGFNLPPLKRGFRVTRVTMTWGKFCLFSWLHWHYCAWMHQVLLKTLAWVKAVRAKIPQPVGPCLVPQAACCCCSVPRSASPSVLWTGTNKVLGSFLSSGVHSLLRTLDIQPYSCPLEMTYVYVQMCTDTWLYLFIGIKSYLSDISTTNTPTSVMCLQKYKVYSLRMKWQMIVWFKECFKYIHRPLHTGFVT